MTAAYVLFMIQFSLNSIQKINEQKLQAFDIGAMGKRPLSRREQEERRKREEETAAAHVMSFNFSYYISKENANFPFIRHLKSS